MAAFPHPTIRQGGNTTSATPSPSGSPPPSTSGQPDERGVSLSSRLGFVGIILLAMLLIMTLRRTRLWERARAFLYSDLLRRDPPVTPPTSRVAARATGANWPRSAPDASANLLPMPRLDERVTPPPEAPDACLVCLDDLSTQPVAAGPCHHWAHSECLKLWLAKDAARTCPACRQPMVGPAAPAASSVAATTASNSDMDAAEAASADADGDTRSTTLPDGPTSLPGGRQQHQHQHQHHQQQQQYSARSPLNSQQMHASPVGNSHASVAAAAVTAPHASARG